MSSNDITGDRLVTKNTNDAYRDGWDRIFSKKERPEQPEITLPRTAFFLKCVEHERGWGQRDGGYFAFASKERADAWRAKQYESRTKQVPDWYENYEDAGWHPITEARAQTLLSMTDRTYLYFNSIEEAIK